MKSKQTDPWPDKRCHAEPNRLVAEQFKQVIEDAADERPGQQFLAAHPELLSCLLSPGGGAWAFDRPRFGAEYIPDFLICTQNSSGRRWAMIELESPVANVLTAAGLPAKKLNEALAQIRDWRAWVRKNIAYAHNELGFTDLDADCPAFIVIGRRYILAPEHASRYRELSTTETTVLTYDRLFETISRGRGYGDLLDGQ